MNLIKETATVKVWEADGAFISGAYMNGEVGAEEPVRFIVVDMLKGEKALGTNDKAEALNFAAKLTHDNSMILNEEDTREWSGASIEADHAAALVMNEEIDTLARKLADRRCYWMSAEHIANVQQEDIASYKLHAFDNGPRVAQHIIKVIINAKRIAKTLTGYLEHEPKSAPGQMVEASEIPF